MKSKCSSLSFRNGLEDKFEQLSIAKLNEDVQTVTNIPVNDQLQTPEDIINDDDTNPQKS